MSPQGVASLDSQLEAYERSTGRQLIVWIGATTGDAPIEDWAVRAFQTWKVGRKGLDDGVALFIMSADRRLRIEVGYGMEGQVPDAIASRIINEVMVPRIQAGDRDGAVVAGTAALMRVMGGEALPAERSTQGREGLRFGQLIVFGIIGIIFLFFFLTNPAMAMWLLASILSSGGDRRRGGGGWGGGGFGGGGFGGGGGRSGGGGASGSW